MAGESPATYLLGPGSLIIGETGSDLDMTAQLTGGSVEWDKDKEDDTPVLSGGVLAGETTYTASLSGNVFQDLATDGLVDWSWTNKGTQVPVVFIPNTEAGKQITGEVIVDPIDVGGDEMKRRPRSDFEWAFVGEPVLTDVAPG